MLSCCEAEACVGACYEDGLVGEGSRGWEFEGGAEGLGEGV